MKAPGSRNTRWTMPIDRSSHPSLATQTANRVTACPSDMITSKEAFELHFPLAHAMRFVPMKLGKADGSGRQADLADAFERSPATSTISGFQVGNLTNRKIDGNRLDPR